MYICKILSFHSKPGNQFQGPVPKCPNLHLQMTKILELNSPLISETFWQHCKLVLMIPLHDGKTDPNNPSQRIRPWQFPREVPTRTVSTHGKLKITPPTASLTRKFEQYMLGIVRGWKNSGWGLSQWEISQGDFPGEIFWVGHYWRGAPMVCKSSSGVASFSLFTRTNHIKPS